VRGRVGATSDDGDGVGFGAKFGAAEAVGDVELLDAPPPP
jgi:hypothetical protein